MLRVTVLEPGFSGLVPITIELARELLLLLEPVVLVAGGLE